MENLQLIFDKFERYFLANHLFYVAVIFALILNYWIFPKKIRPIYSRRQMLNDFILFFIPLMPVVSSVWNFIFSLGLSSVSVASWFKINFLIIDVLVYCLLSSFVGYWVHRLFHLKLSWYIHRLHHSGRDFNVILKFRANPFELTVHSLSFLLIYSVVSFEVYVYTFVGALRVFHEMLLHGDGVKNFPRFIRVIFVTPENHKVHHLLEPVNPRGVNFSNDLVIWDKLFKTYCGNSGANGEVGVRFDGGDLVEERFFLKMVFDDMKDLGSNLLNLLGRYFFKK